MEKVLILPHKNPDTDATCSAIALAELFKAKKIWNTSAQINDSLNRETLFVLKHFKVSKPGRIKIAGKSQKVILIDFNEEEQSPVPFKKVVIEGLFDHHKLNVKFSKEYPIYFRVEPIGSSCSLVYKMYKDLGVKPAKNIAGIMLAGILSDTLCFTSPTTTEEDQKLAKELATIVKANIKKLATAMFKAKSDLSGLSPQKIVAIDFKEFKFGKKKTGIGVLETVDIAPALQMEQKLRKALSEQKRKNKLDLVFFGIVDIIQGNSKFLLIGKEEEAAARKAFPKASIKEAIIDLPGVVSRKKQITPIFEKTIS